jgi:hypothetical protein
MKHEGEEFWIYNVVKDFEYILHKYPEKVLEFSQDAVGMQQKLYKALLTNMDKKYDVDVKITNKQVEQHE